MPTVIFAVAGVNSTLNVTWTDNAPKDLILSEEPSYSFATAIDKVRTEFIKYFANLDKLC